eukprot:219538-Chlamydomonas_euryale.AAC.3
MFLLLATALLLLRTWRAIEQDALWRLHADGLKELRVAQWQLHELADLRELLAHAAHIVVANLRPGWCAAVVQRSVGRWTGGGGGCSQSEARWARRVAHRSAG